MIVINLGVLLHPGHDVLYCILDTTTRSLLWSYSRLFEVFYFIKRKLDEVIVVNPGVLYHPEHGVLYYILNTTTLNENKLVYPTCSAMS